MYNIAHPGSGGIVHDEFLEHLRKTRKLHCLSRAVDTQQVDQYLWQVWVAKLLHPGHNVWLGIFGYELDDLQELAFGATLNIEHSGMPGFMSNDGLCSYEFLWHAALPVLRLRPFQETLGKRSPAGVQLIK
jgi:hypothetical protein